MRESDIMHENGAYWVGRTKSGYVVFRSGVTHSTSDSAYELNADGLSIAIARCDYLARHSVKIQELGAERQESAKR